MTDLHAMSGAYAVDALDDFERARFERHLADCPDCAAEVASLQEAAALLALSVDQAPSSALRSRVLTEIKTVRPLPPTAPAKEVAHRTARRFPQLVAAAVAVIVVGTGVGLVVNHDDTNNAPPAATPSVTERVMDASDARTQSVSVTGGGEATVWHSPSVGRAVLVTKDLPALPRGKAYELWFQDKGGTFVPAGLLDSGGNRTIALHGDVRQAKGVGVTVEPAQGSQHPTTLPVAMFDLRKSV